MYWILIIITLAVFFSVFAHSLIQMLPRDLSHRDLFHAIIHCSGSNFSKLVSYLMQNVRVTYMH